MLPKTAKSHSREKLREQQARHYKNPNNSNLKRFRQWKVSQEYSLIGKCKRKNRWRK
jgi:hypothetical protein